MDRLITVGFEFCEKIYQSIIRVKVKKGFNEYKITIMNGDLEKLLYGNHVIKEINGFLQIEIIEHTSQELLKLKIGEALSKLIGIPLNSKLSY